MGHLLVEPLLDVARRLPEKVAVNDSVRSLTFRRLSQLAVVMRDIISRRSDRETIGIMLPGGGGFSSVFFGSLLARRVAVPLNFLFSAEELTPIVNDAGLDTVFTTRHFEQTVSPLPVTPVFLEDLPLKRRMFFSGWHGLPDAPSIDPDDLAVILYTSGTSGASKGVELSARNLRSNCDAITEAVDLRDDDRFLCLLPPFHVFGLTANTLVPVTRGLMSQVVPRFNPGAVFRAIRDYRPTVMMAIPSMYASLLRARSADADAFASFRLLISGGEPLPTTVAEGFLERFGATLLEGYGLTETSPVISLNTPVDKKRGTVGKPLGNVDIRLVDENGGIVSDGSEGEIVVRGPGIMRGYHNKPRETRDVLTGDGWFSTGDLGTLDAEGFLKITGRRKDLIIVGGENIHPREIEDVLERHPAVAAAAVIGVPDASRGEVPLAFVVTEPSATVAESDLRQLVRQTLAGFKVPRQIRFVEDLPRGPTGKVLKRVLRDAAAQVRLDDAGRVGQPSAKP